MPSSEMDSGEHEGASCSAQTPYSQVTLSGSFGMGWGLQLLWTSQEHVGLTRREDPRAGRADSRASPCPDGAGRRARGTCTGGTWEEGGGGITVDLPREEG